MRFSFIHRSLGAAGILALALGAAGCAQTGGHPEARSADTVLVNGKVITVDRRFAIHEALAIRDGKIVAVGPTSSIRGLAGSGTRVVDLAGRAVIPGLIDNHTHAIRAAERWAQEARIDGVTSRRQALDIIAAKARAARPGAWILVLGGWTEDQFTDAKGGFTREELDAAAPNHPVFAQVLFARGYANSLALKAAGLYHDDPARTRVLLTPAIRKVRAAVPAVPADEWRAGLRALMAEFNRVGLTSIVDVGGNGFTQRHYEPIAELDRQGQLTLRFYYMRFTSAAKAEAVDRVIAEVRKLTPRAGSDYFRLLGIGENVFTPTTDNTYRPFKPRAQAFAQWERIAAAAGSRGLQVHQHMTHDNTISAFLDRIEVVNFKTPVAPLRWTLAHLDGISQASLDRVRHLGVGVAVHSRPSIQGRMVTKRWGGAAGDMPPLRMIQDSGVVMGLGSDTTIVAPYNPFVSLWWAVTGRMLDGTKVNNQTLTRAEALIAHTRSNAWLMFEERRLGSLEPGKLADLVVLDRDYLTVPEGEIKDIRPVMTMVGGKVVYEARR